MPHAPEPCTLGWQGRSGYAGWYGVGRKDHRRRCIVLGARLAFEYERTMNKSRTTQSAVQSVAAQRAIYATVKPLQREPAPLWTSSLTSKPVWSGRGSDLSLPRDDRRPPLLPTVNLLLGTGGLARNPLFQMRRGNPIRRENATGPTAGSQARALPATRLSSAKAGDPRPGDPRAGDPRPGDPSPGDPRLGDPPPGGPAHAAAAGLLPSPRMTRRENQPEHPIHREPSPGRMSAPRATAIPAVIRTLPQAAARKPTSAAPAVARQ